jgi:hypothetical protein
MEKKVTETGLAYGAEDGTVYLITPITPIAGVLGFTGEATNLPADLKHIWEDSLVSKLVLFVPAEQEEYIKIVRQAGFKQEGRLKKATIEGDLLVFGQYR